jgi:hypothetical protein
MRIPVAKGTVNPGRSGERVPDDTDGSAGALLTVPSLA